MHIPPEITVGNLITATTLIVGGIIAWQKLRDFADESRRRIEKLEELCEELGHRYNTIEAVLSGIKADSGWIKESLRRKEDREDSQ